MKLPLSLIKSFMQVDLPPVKLGEILTLLGIEVDGIEEGHDPIFELSLTPNLGHCMSALGVARELSAALQLPLTLPKTHQMSGREIKVSIQNPALAPRYLCLLIEQIKVGPSPSWLKKQLEACGQKSINLIVDATNYIMMKFGQPLHAFDADLIEREEIRVECAQSSFSFVGLDGVAREVPEGALLIRDAKKPLALAGIMGGAESAVTDQTTRILLEAAVFDPIAIRVTAKKVGLRTESSQRFEKGVDPMGLELALSEAAHLIGAQIVGFKTVQPVPFKKREIHYRPHRINQILGTKLSETEIEEILGRLEIEAKGGKAHIPSYRRDLLEEIDLSEEVARVYGYNNIEKGVPHLSTSTLPNDPVFLFENEMRRHLIGAGLTEFLTCDLISPSLAEIAREISPLASLQTAYSKSEEFSFLRTSLLPGLLQVTKGNFAQKNTHIAAFEIGRIHFEQNREIIEFPMAAILLTGLHDLPHWSHKGREVDFFDLKGILENLFHSSFLPSSHLSFHPGRQADIYIDDLRIGSLGEVHPHLLQKFDLEKRVYYAELNLLNLLKKKKTHLKMVPLPQFPSSERDLTIPLPLKMPMEKLFEEIRAHHSSLLERVELIDLYLPEGQEVKNVTLRFIYRDLTKTISFEEAEAAHAKIIKALKMLAS